MLEQWRQEKQMLLSKADQLHKFLLKKIKREIASGQSVLHLSSKQQQIKELLAEKNHYTKVRLRR